MKASCLKSAASYHYLAFADEAGEQRGWGGGELCTYGSGIGYVCMCTRECESLYLSATSQIGSKKRPVLWPNSNRKYGH
jgi:hypothetical protein